MATIRQPKRTMTSFDELRLETSRLVLRPPRADDLDAWAEMMLDEPSARFIGGTMPRAVCWRQAGVTPEKPQPWRPTGHSKR